MWQLPFLLLLSVTSLHHHFKHHDPHTEETLGEVEASDGEGPKILHLQ